jgi:hypothetical protein
MLSTPINMHYKKSFYYPQTIIHGLVMVGNFKSTDDLPMIKLSIKLRICFELFEIVTHGIALNNYRRHKIIIFTLSLIFIIILQIWIK